MLNAKFFYKVAEFLKNDGGTWKVTFNGWRFSQRTNIEDETCTMHENSGIKIAPWMKYQGIFFPNGHEKLLFYFCIMNENVHLMDENLKLCNGWKVLNERWKYEDIIQHIHLLQF